MKLKKTTWSLVWRDARSAAIRCGFVLAIVWTMAGLLMSLSSAELENHYPAKITMGLWISVGFIGLMAVGGRNENKQT